MISHSIAFHYFGWGDMLFLSLLGLLLARLAFSRLTIVAEPTRFGNFFLMPLCRSPNPGRETESLLPGFGFGMG